MLFNEEEDEIPSSNAPECIEGKTFVDLNVDCLEYIFQKLDKLDLYSVYYSSRHFQSIILSHLFRIKSYEFDNWILSKHPMAERILELLILGSHITKLQVQDFRGRFSVIEREMINFNTIACFCRNLQSLRMENSKLFMNVSWSESIVLFDKLEYLELCDCKVIGSFTDKCIDFSNLKYLKIWNSSCSSVGLFACKLNFPKLKSIILNNAKDINAFLQ